MEIESNTFYIITHKKDYTRTLIKGSQIIAGSKKYAKPVFEMLLNFDVTLATTSEILLYARKEQLHDSN